MKYAENKEKISDTIDQLIEILISYDGDELEIGKDYIYNLIGEIDVLLERVKLKWGSKVYDLIAEEFFFQQYAYANIDQYNNNMESSAKKFFQVPKKIKQKNTIKTEKENYFRLEKDYWQICFQGKSWSIKQSVGMQYITLLIQRAYNDDPEIHVVELVYLAQGRPLEKETVLNGLTKEQLSEMGFDVTGLGNGLDVMTREGKEWARSQIQQFAEQIKEAEEHGHTKEVLLLRETKETLEDHIKKAVGLHGRARKTSDLNENMRKSVSKAIANVLGKMGKKEGDELAVYLDDHIEKGLFCSFRKDPIISWEIMKK